MIHGMEMPAAEVEIDETFVAGLLQEQFPELAGQELRLLTNGWDNAIFRLGEDLAVRLPRRQAAVELIHNEQRWLPQLASHTRVPVPIPVYVGRPGRGYPWPWSITRWHPGVIAAELPAPQRGTIAVAMAEFLNTWHRPAPPDAPHNPVRGTPLQWRDAGVREGLASGSIPHAEELGRLWDRLVDTPPWPHQPRWLHGDLHPANILIHDGQLAAVLDFGDLTAGDPAADLAVAWLAFDADARAVLRQHVEADEDTWARAHGWAIALTIAFLRHSDDNPLMASIGRHALDQVHSVTERS